MDTQGYLLLANGLVWLALLGYVAFLGARQAGLAKKLRLMNALSENAEGDRR